MGVPPRGAAGGLNGSVSNFPATKPFEMISNEASNLAERLRNRECLPMEKLEMIVGMDRGLNDLLVEHLVALPPDPGHLAVCELMLIENPEKITPVIKRVFASFPEKIHGFVGRLLESPFYIQRQSIPSLILNIEYREAKEVLRRCLLDPVVSVVRCAALSLEKYETVPFEDEELVELVEGLHGSYSEYVQCTAASVIPLIRRQTPFVREICMSASWRRRYAIAKRIQSLSAVDRATVYSYLCQDQEEEIRICLAKNMEHGGDWRRFAPLFLKDSSSAVRALTIKMIGDREEFQEMLKEAVSDGNWEVRKALLSVQRTETYRSVVIPLINSLSTTLNWRIRREVLESIASVSRQDERLLKELLGRYLLGYLCDRIHEIRAEAARVAGELVLMYPWTDEWLPEIDAAVSSRNYLHRITSVGAAIAFDRIHKTGFVKRLLGDPIDNVKLYTLKMISGEMDCDTRELVAGLCSSGDGEVRQAAKDLLDAMAGSEPGRASE